MNIVVLAGGYSSEADVSRVSGMNINKALINKGYNSILIDLSKDINDDEVDTIFDIKKNYEYKIDEIPCNIKKKKTFFAKNTLEVCKKADLVFIALHGGEGENGKLQALFDLLNIKYTGSNYLGSMISMNKDIAKALVLNNNLKTAKFKTYRNKNIKIKTIEKNHEYPLVIKSAIGGSSINVYLIHNQKELKKAINKLKKLKDLIIVEDLIIGREFSVGIINKKALPIIEIKPKNGFYDYKNKYQKGLTDEICPANLSYEEEIYLKALALKIFKILKIDSYARLDFIRKDKDDFYFLEANTLPGMTDISLLPREAKALNIDFDDLCEIIVDLALDKKQNIN